MPVRHIIGWLSAVVLAALVGSWSYAVANEKLVPAKALAAGSLFAGTAKASLAFRSFVTRQGGRVNGAERKLVEDAYKAEPLSISALGILALSMTGEADARRRQSLLELTGKLSRRSALVSNELIKSAAVRNDDLTFFTWLSRLMLTGDEAKQAYGSAMADATAKDGAVEALTPIIGPGPRWSDFYWGMVVRRPNSLVNAARLRIAVAGQPWRQTEVKPADEALLSGLVRKGEFDVARELADSLSPLSAKARRKSANLLNDGDFTTVPILAPFDWQLSTSGNLGASIDGRGGLLISAIGGARGAAARQLLRLVPGEYSAAWKISASGEIGSQVLSARLECAEQGVGNAAPARIPLSQTVSEARIHVPDGVCHWYWFSIAVEIPDNNPGVDLNLQRLALTKVVER